MKDWNIDVAVLLIFFCRDEQFAKVFEQVKKARPRVLLLYQDGAREGVESDRIGIDKCRRIAENIDWDCEVHRFYQDKNVGCDPSEFIAQKWAFDIVDKCIVLEDDDVPSQSFFPYCKELLDYYENDERINMICGMNNNDVTEDIKASYLFTTKGSIWGWASWKRVIDTWDDTYSILDDEEQLKRLKENFDSEQEYNSFINTCKRHKASGKAHYESINAISMFKGNRLNIVPKYNMISNVGIGAVTTHGGDDINIYPEKIRKLLFKEVYEIEFPLIHPNYVMRNREFERKMMLSGWDKFTVRAEGIYLKLRHKGIGYCLELLKSKLHK